MSYQGLGQTVPLPIVSAPPEVVAARNAADRARYRMYFAVGSALVGGAAAAGVASFTPASKYRATIGLAVGAAAGGLAHVVQGFGY